MAAIAPASTSTVQIPTDLYKEVREFLSDSEEVGSAAVDRFVEKAVSNYLLDKASQQIQETMAPQLSHLSEDELMEQICEVVREVRAHR